MKKLMGIFMTSIILCSVSPVLAHYFPSINMLQEEKGASGLKNETAGSWGAFSSFAAAPLAWINKSGSRYDEGNCNTLIGSVNLDRVQKVRMNGSTVDFADEVHFNHAPAGDAVICWGNNGQVAIKGKLYSDNGNAQVARVQFRLRYARGGFSGNINYSHSTSGGWVSHKVITVATVPGGFDQVRIRLRRTIRGKTTTVMTRTFTR